MVPAIHYLTALLLTHELSHHELEASIHSRLRHFEVLTTGQIKTRTRRHTGATAPHARLRRVSDISVRFTGLGREFHLSLTPGWTCVIPHVTEMVLVTPGDSYETLELDLSRVYSGSLLGRARTSVKAFRHRGAWTAYIADTKTDYVIEPMSRYEPQAKPNRMVLYRTSDFITTNETSVGARPFCHYRNYTTRTRRSTENVRLNRKPLISKRFSRNTFSNTNEYKDVRRQQPRLWKRQNEFRYTFEAIPKDFIFYSKFCDILLMMDYKTLQEHYKGDAKYAAYKTLFYYEKSNEIFSTTNFGNFTGVKNVVAKLQIMKSHSTKLGEEWNFPWTDSRKLWHPGEILESLAYNRTLDTFCVAHLVTQRSMWAGYDTVGVANVATVSQWGGAFSGVCGGKDNRLITTMYKNFEPVSETAIIQVLTHELGHSYGAIHDHTRRCAPPMSHGGRYLMWWASPSFHEPNNLKFSQCSIISIMNVLEQIEHRCFIPLERFRDNFRGCGNGVWEPEEECDEGEDVHRSGQGCCTQDCRVRKYAACSPSSSPCCSPHCLPANNDTECLSGYHMECHDVSRCDGVDSSLCPPPRAVRDGSSCGSDHLTSGQCEAGSCLPLCTVIGRAMSPRQLLLPCVCEGDDSRDLCRVCCRKSSGHPCEPTDVPLREGDMCSHGVCHQGTCRATYEHRNYRTPVSAFDSLTSLLVVVCLYIACVCVYGLFVIFTVKVSFRVKLPETDNTAAGDELPGTIEEDIASSQRRSPSLTDARTLAEHMKQRAF